jgi:hypothetical protein
MAESNHDLTEGGRGWKALHCRWPSTADWGFPARSHALDTLQAFDPRAGQSWYGGGRSSTGSGSTVRRRRLMAGSG